RIQSLGHAQIFCTSNPRGQTTFFASYVVEGSSFPSGSMFFTIPSSSSNPLSVTPLATFHCSISSVVPNFLSPCLQSGYNNFCDPPTSSQTSLTPLKFHSLFVNPLEPDLIHQVVGLLLYFLQPRPFLQHRSWVHLQRLKLH